MKAYEIMNHLEKYFPLNLQMDFDCCGLQIGSREKEVKKVYIALNLYIKENLLKELLNMALLFIAYIHV